MLNTVGTSEYFSEFVNGHSGLFDDGGERSGFEVFIVIWDRDKERRVVGMLEVIMAAGDSLKVKAYAL